MTTATAATNGAVSVADAADANPWAMIRPEPVLLLRNKTAMAALRPMLRIELRSWAVTTAPSTRKKCVLARLTDRLIARLAEIRSSTHAGIATAKNAIAAK